MNCLITLREGLVFYYTETKQWSRNPHSAHGYSWKEIKNFKRNFSKAGTGTFVIAYPAPVAIGIQRPQEPTLEEIESQEVEG